MVQDNAMDLRINLIPKRPRITMPNSALIIHCSLFTTHHFCSAYPVVQGFTEEWNEEKINNGYTHQAPEQNSPECGPFALLIHHFGITEPFGRTALENEFKKTVVDKNCPKKNPPKIQIRVTPVAHVKSPTLIQSNGQNKNE